MIGLLAAIFILMMVAFGGCGNDSQKSSSSVTPAVQPQDELGELDALTFDYSNIEKALPETQETQQTQGVSQQFTQQETEQVTQQIQEAKISADTRKMLRNKSGLYHFTAEYPEVTVSGVDNAKDITAKMNENIVAYMRRCFENFLALTAGAPGNSKDTFDKTMNYAVVYNSSSVISFRFDTVQRSAGQINSDLFVSSLNLDAKSGQVIKVGDLFVVGSNYVKVLSDYSLKAMKADKAIASINTGDADQDKLIKEDLFAKAQPKEENFQNFNLTGNSLIIYFRRFDKERVGAYGGADLSNSAAAYIEIPFGKLSKVIDTGKQFVSLK